MAPSERCEKRNKQAGKKRQGHAAVVTHGAAERQCDTQMSETSMDAPASVTVGRGMVKAQQQANDRDGQQRTAGIAAT